MTFWQLIRRNLRFHARAHLGVVLGAAIGSAALLGALVVGDSVRESLTNMALRRLGNLDFAIATQDRLFQVSLGPRLSAIRPPDPIQVRSTPPAYSQPSPVWPYSLALELPGIVSRQDGTARANQVTVLGVDADTWPRLAEWGRLSPGAWLPGPEGERLNRDGVTMLRRERGQGPLSLWQRGET